MSRPANNLGVYVGHTTTNFHKRAFAHIMPSDLPGLAEYSVKKYPFIRANGVFANWDVELVEEWPCTNLEAALIRERYWSDKLGATLNAIRPYYISKEERKVVREESYQRNKEQHLALMGQMVEECECGATVTRGKLARHKWSGRHKELVSSGASSGSSVVVL